MTRKLCVLCGLRVRTVRLSSAARHVDVRVEHDGGSLDVHAGQAVVTAPGEWVRYSTPGPDGADYVAVCLPAFSPATVHRDERRRTPQREIGSGRGQTGVRLPSDPDRPSAPEESTLDLQLSRFFFVGVRRADDLHLACPFLGVNN